ncbi:ATP-binding cassette domain-containing protein [Dactylosporangium aurantiacum]|uniref:ATP-binding cassette domain-containing protein n=1 Tax=Dactylosporangium aurantiacum TaxID=35754 RepID=A0A9Q9ID51_9ACTN|nr:ATP-binding cassette domain-containing protein [Dactylosporangium aurantiacum]MDG6106574.1 ATP-binding cassette domain-containing protein [Dactylosporangium aurantiacum]UWZ50400.1 ATP-binding cassette domain-containing protein [Dactylosporangium aurantiacum]
MIDARDLRKRYGGSAALDGLDLTVAAGTVHGLLGPNGAGKTTLVRILATLVHLDSGTATVAGHDVHRHPERVRAAIGLVGQHAAVDELLSARQNLVMFGRLSHLGHRAARRRADALLEQFGLTDVGEKPAGRFSGGTRRRLDLAAGMILTPRVLFLDEPTTGLDPHARAEVWTAVRHLAAGGTTVLLTTQYLDEADQLADHVSVMHHGRVIAAGTPAELKGPDRLDVLTTGDPATAAARLGTLGPVTVDGRKVSVAVHDRVAALTLAATLPDVADITVRRPTLDEAFLHLVAA